MLAELSGNPTFAMTSEDRIDFCLAPPAGVNHITIGSITDGGIINVYLNDQWLNANDIFFFRNGGASDLLRQAGIEVTPLTSSGELATDSGGGRYYDADRASIVNTTSVQQNIRIVLLDANSVDRNYTLENQSFRFDPQTSETTFTLSPAV